MLKKIIKSLYFTILLYFLFLKSASTEIVKSIEILGNERIADETILMFSKIKIGSDLDKNDINNSLSLLYESNFFENVNINFSNKQKMIVDNWFKIYTKFYNHSLKNQTCYLIIPYLAKQEMVRPHLMIILFFVG